MLEPEPLQGPAPHVSSELERFASAFVEAVVFTDAPEMYAGDGFAASDEAALRKAAGAFFEANEADVLTYPEGVIQAGHDLWFTVAGHGVGYWENDDDVSRRLDVAAEALGLSGDVYEGDDGRLYWKGIER